MKLLTPVTFRNITLNNRLVMSPMCMYSAKDGIPNDFHFVHYTTRAYGGLGLIMIEATGVEPEGRISPYCLGLWKEEQQNAFQKIVNFIHENTSAKIGIQLAHAGRKGSTMGTKQLDESEGGWTTVAPSAIPFRETDRIPKELSLADIQKQIENFTSAAKRAIDAGFDIIELHAAHGYLIHQFLSPISNTRTDAYGGSFENRIRFLTEIIAAIQPIIADRAALFVRISATEYAPNGWDIEDSIRLAQKLKEAGVDLIDVSSGGNYVDAKISPFSGYQVAFSEHIKTAAALPTSAVGMIKDIETAEEILEKQQADLVMMGRELLLNPYLLIQAKSLDKSLPVSVPRQYERAL